MIKKIPKDKIIILVLAGILAILAIIKIIDNNYQKQEPQNINTNIIETAMEKEDDETEEKIIIYITGEVNKQGVIELKQRKQNSRRNRKSRRTNTKRKHQKRKPSI